MLIGVPAERVEAVWPIVAPMLAKAIRRGQGDYDLGHVREWVLARDWQLWVWLDGDIRCAAATTIINWPNRRVCSVPLVGGHDLADWWREGVDGVGVWAKSQGCDCLEGYDPRGAKSVWARVLPGWRGCWTVIRRAL